MMALAETGVCACFLTGTQTMCEQRGGGGGYSCSASVKCT